MNEEGGRGERLGEKKRVGEPGKDWHREKDWKGEGVGEKILDDVKDAMYLREEI